MTIDFSALQTTNRLLIEATLAPLQGERFQPTGFPDIGAALFNTPGSDKQKLMVESSQSMANRLELTCWDDSKDELIEGLEGLSYVRVEEDGNYLTSSNEESHRLNSPYILESADKDFYNKLTKSIEALELDKGKVKASKFARLLLEYDVSTLLHGVFIAKKELVGGRLRLARALSAFIEADGVQVAMGGGVKKDNVNPSGDTKAGFGHVPFHRDEYVAENITAFFSLDLAQLRSYRLGESAYKMLVALALFKISRFLEGDLRLRTNCDLQCVETKIKAPQEFKKLPSSEAVLAQLRELIKANSDSMKPQTAIYKKK